MIKKIIFRKLKYRPVKNNQLYEKIMNFSQEMEKCHKILLCNSHTSTFNEGVYVCVCVFVEYVK